MEERCETKVESKWKDSRDETLKERLDIGFDSLKQKWQAADAEFTDETLKICGHPVMEAWEREYMRDLAEIATSRGGKVLEVGYGMGISAGFVQANPIEEHVIIEANAGVLEKAEIFAASAKSPVRLLHGFWEDVVPTLPSGGFSGILFDTYPLVPDEVHQNHFAFFKEAYRLLAPAGVLTYYSDEFRDFAPEHIACLKAAGFDKVSSRMCPVDPPEDCRYWKEKTILSPIIIK